VKSFTIVIHFKLFEYLLFCLSEGQKFLAIDGSEFKAVIPIFYRRIVLAIAYQAHAIESLIFVKSILWAVEQYWLPRSVCLMSSLGCFRRHYAISKASQTRVAIICPDSGDIRHPFKIWRSSPEV
jgi:hypothetical protein